MLDCSLDNDVPIHESSPGSDGDRPGRLVLYVGHFSFDTIFCEWSRSSFWTGALWGHAPFFCWVRYGRNLYFPKFGGWHWHHTIPPLRFCHVSGKKKRKYFCFVFLIESCKKRSRWLLLTQFLQKSKNRRRRSKIRLTFDSPHPTITRALSHPSPIK